MGEFLSSLDTVEELGARLVLAGHGRPFADVAEHIAANRKLVAQRLDAVLAGLADGPATAYDLAPAVYGEAFRPEVASWLLTKLLCFLTHLEAIGAVERAQESPSAGLGSDAMRIDERIAAGTGPSFSFEFFPPKTEAGTRNLERGARRALHARPDVRLGHLRRRRQPGARSSRRSTSSRT